MNIDNTYLNEVKVIAPIRHGDNRGWFMETYSEKQFREKVSDVRFVQDNHSKSSLAGTLRGLHFQIPPFAQGKLVRCVSGKIWDVAVDLRKNSANYGKWAAAELSPENSCQLFVPAGFAHGFITLAADTEVIYKCTEYYDSKSDAGIAWNDPDINLPWPLPLPGPILSSKDDKLPYLKNFSNPF